MFWYRLLWFKTSDLKPVSNADVCLFLCQFKAIWSWAFDPVWSSRAQLTTAFLIFSRFLALLLSSSKTCTHFPTKQNRTNLFMSLNPASTMITLRPTLAPKNDPELARNNQNSHVTITYTGSDIQVLVERR